MLPCSPLTIILSLFFYPVSHCILLNTTSYFRLPLFCSSAIAGFMMCNDEVIRFFLIAADFFIIFIISLVSSRSSSIARCRLETRDLLKLQGSVLINHAASRRWPATPTYSARVLLCTNEVLYYLPLSMLVRNNCPCGAHHHASSSPRVPL